MQYISIFLAHKIPVTSMEQLLAKLHYDKALFYLAYMHFIRMIEALYVTHAFVLYSTLEHDFLACKDDGKTLAFCVCGCVVAC